MKSESRNSPDGHRRSGRSGRSTNRPVPHAALVETREHDIELRARQRQRAAAHRGPDEAAALKALVHHHYVRAVAPEQLDLVLAPLAAKHRRDPGIRIEAQLGLDHGREAVRPLRKAHRAGRPHDARRRVGGRHDGRPRYAATAVIRTVELSSGRRTTTGRTRCPTHRSASGRRPSLERTAAARRRARAPVWQRGSRRQREP